MHSAQAKPVVLIADDDAPSRGAYVIILRLAGYEVCQANDGEEALRLLEVRPVDLVVLDLALPPAGVSVLEEMRGHRRWREVPVVVITALPEAEAARRLAHTEVAGLLIKGRFSKRDLVGRIDHLLARPVVA
jgi:two-component system, OmpR family, phosphate regulon response regulator PhoB